MVIRRGFKETLKLENFKIKFRTKLLFRLKLAVFF